MNEPDQYFLGYRTAEQQRLQRQADELAAESVWLFDTIGSLEGKEVLEIGCGPRGCLDLLSARVGPSGRVVGLERSPEAVELAKRMVAERGLSNVEVVCGDAKSSGLPPARFDLVTSRLVLVNVPDPKQVVSEATRLARPGGAVAFHEADWLAFICDPPSAGWTGFVDRFVRYSEANGIDLFVGRKLPRLLRRAGLTDVSVRPILHVLPPEHARRPLVLQVADNLKDRMISEGHLTEAEYAELRQDLARCIADPETFVIHGPYFQAWARKPSA
ncbi:MAG TPA: methyltransferase domain-containing protein [Caulobacteraceae bacterium]|jgi:ubiquinone/menaquinone biosynthesis C-methylase UbiE|nr:methyltransferase domain-containing protein [Caulobacteraceae bacterium]